MVVVSPGVQAAPTFLSKRKGCKNYTSSWTHVSVSVSFTARIAKQNPPDQKHPPEPSDPTRQPGAHAHPLLRQESAAGALAQHLKTPRPQAHSRRCQGVWDHHLGEGGRASGRARERDLPIPWLSPSPPRRPRWPASSRSSSSPRRPPPGPHPRPPPQRSAQLQRASSLPAASSALAARHSAATTSTARSTAPTRRSTAATRMSSTVALVRAASPSPCPPQQVRTHRALPLCYRSFDLTS